MDKIIVTTNAKINLSLDVVNKREDGYHNLKMIMQSVDLSDTITIEKSANNDIEIKTNLYYLPVNETNIAYKSAQLFFEESGVEVCGLKIDILKKIPVAAGLAGGSSNGAGVLKGLNQMFGEPLSRERLMEISVKIGADVPYCLMGGTALAEGIGEKLTQLKPMPKCKILLVKPPFGISTPRIFSRLKVERINYRPHTKGIIDAIERGDVLGIARRMYNVLENITGKDQLEIRKIKNRLIDNGALGSVMSGSGPTVFGIFDDEQLAKKAYAHFKEKYRDVFLCNPV